MLNDHDLVLQEASALDRAWKMKKMLGSFEEIRMLL